MKSTFSNILQRLTELQTIGGLSAKEVKLLSKPQRTNKATLTVGKKKIPAWRILFNDALGPGKGGVRFHPAASQDEVTSLAFWMMIKNSLAEIPYGGAKGAIKFDPKVSSPKTLEIVSRKFIDAFYQNLGQDKDIPAPDVYTNSQIMAWMLDEYEKKVGHHEPAMITGKPLSLGGCRLREDSTAKGGFIIIKEILKTFNLKKSQVRVAIQGFGNAGSNLARLLNEDKFKIVAVSDSQGGIYQETGLNITAVEKTKREQGSVVNFPEGSPLKSKEILFLPVDILILAALENQITLENVNQVQAPYIVEIANGPITYPAEQKLFTKKTIVVPDVLANAGGVIVSYFEWCQNKTGNILEEDYLAGLLEKKMIRNWQRIVSLKKKHQNKINLKTAAYLLAIQRILEAEKLRGRI